eukprot:478466-Rhodomonas_salina.1
MSFVPKHSLLGTADSKTRSQRATVSLELRERTVLRLLSLSPSLPLLPRRHCSEYHTFPRAPSLFSSSSSFLLLLTHSRFQIHTYMLTQPQLTHIRTFPLSDAHTP